MNVCRCQGSGNNLDVRHPDCALLRLLLALMHMRHMMNPKAQNKASHLAGRHMATAAAAAAVRPHPHPHVPALQRRTADQAAEQQTDERVAVPVGEQAGTHCHTAGLHLQWHVSPERTL